MSRRRTQRHAYTLIEMVVVTALLVLIAGLVYPNLANVRDARERRDFVRGLPTLAREARERAISEGRVVSVRLGSNDATLELYSEDLDTGSGRVLRSVTIPAGFQTGQAVTGDLPVPSSEWELRFYPDGSSETGGIEFSENNGPVFALVVENEAGRVRLVDGNVPDFRQNRWEAGDYERRG